MYTDAFMKLNDLLGEVQHALGSGPLDDDLVARITQAADMRQALWAAIADYRDEWIETVKKAHREARTCR